MGRINFGRVILGGLVAGVVYNGLEFLLHGVVLGDDWRAAMAALGKSVEAEGGGDMPLFIAWGFLIGIASLWVYAGIRPRFGPGPKTAITAGVMVWVLSYLLPSAITLAFGLFPGKLVWLPLVVGVVEAPLATVCGAALYKES
jgi:hypothetical protein